MQKLIFIFCAFFSVPVFSQQDIDAVKTRMEAQEISWNKGDIPGFMMYYWKSDSLKFIGKEGVTYGWQTTLDNYTRSYPDKTAMGTLKFGITECSQLSPTSIYVIGSWHLEKKRPSGGYFTLLWKKINGSWVIVADHTS